MTQEQARQGLLDILKSMDKQAEYKPGADIFEDLGLDSLDQIEFLFNIEQKFGVKIEDETFEEQGLRSFDQLASHLAERAA
ncbi:MAG TPA: phosphopantetheine-binding protein [Terriglobales bacterium]|nr:phosphopantetheine-binding protein [Terriglobales bacterium]